jgi:hypothetical protein
MGNQDGSELVSGRLIVRRRRGDGVDELDGRAERVAAVTDEVHLSLTPTPSNL